LWRLDPMSYMKLNFPDLYAQLQQLAMQQAQEQQMAQAQGQLGLNQQAIEGAQKNAQGAQAHAQQIRQGEEMHQAKLKHFNEMASAKLAKVQLPPAEK